MGAFPGNCVRDVKKKLLSLVQPSDYYPLVIFQVGRSEVSIRNPRAIKRDFSVLGQQVKGSEKQAVLSLIHSVAGNDERRNRKSQKINTWIQAWHQLFYPFILCLPYPGSYTYSVVEAEWANGCSSYGSIGASTPWCPSPWMPQEQK